MNGSRTVVVKIGSSSLTTGDGAIDEDAEVDRPDGKQVGRDIFQVQTNEGE